MLLKASTLTLLLATLSTAFPNHFSSPSKTKREDTWGGSVSLGSTKSRIIKSETTIIPGLPPSKQNGMLFLWPGMSNGTGDLIQTTLEQWPDNSWCGASKTQWCVRASLFGSFGQLDGPAGVVSANDQVKIVYTRSANGKTWTQDVTNAQTGKQLSTFSHDSGHMTGWGTGTECNGGCSGTVSEQKYMNTIITLEAADPTFGNTIAKAGGASYTGLSSSEGGKVWKISSISIPPMVK
ncbi:hypothetical protein K469DRAFT_725497 [Zopfia rhizophila CBS 207.26]|uniref:Uncharacterized protein n=1 Tax=Zopfia rhizophila CBS 207.26 TaxID=1314779 RepID=A0A6A6E4G5_9PEZI|nr:hypothetical protein K469DRAFT_725497 [Zopfia rhizophila CBS 207.26]